MNRRRRNPDDVELLIDMGYGETWSYEMVGSLISALGLDPRVVLRDRTEIVNSAIHLNESNSDSERVGPISQGQQKPGASQQAKSKHGKRNKKKGGKK